MQPTLVFSSHRQRPLRLSLSNGLDELAWIAGSMLSSTLVRFPAGNSGATQ